MVRAAGEAPMSPEAEAPSAHQWNHPVLTDKASEPGAGVETEVRRWRFPSVLATTFSLQLQLWDASFCYA